MGEKMAKERIEGEITSLRPEKGTLRSILYVSSMISWPSISFGSSG